MFVVHTGVKEDSKEVYQYIDKFVVGEELQIVVRIYYQQKGDKLYLENIEDDRGLEIFILKVEELVNKEEEQF